MKIKTISTTKARAHISQIIDRVKTHGEVFVFGRRNNPEAILIKFPNIYNPQVSDSTNINAYSESFNFLYDEPELYSVSDMKKKHV